MVIQMKKPKCLFGKMVLLLCVSLLLSVSSVNAKTTDALPAIMHLLLQSSTSGGVSGKITYDRVPAIPSPVSLNYSATVQKPARGATVQLLDTIGTVLDTTTTDTNGNYSFTITDQDKLVRIRVRAELLKTTSGAQYNVKVVDNTSSDALYTLAEAEASSAATHATRNLNASSGWDGSSYTSTRAAAPFAILDSIYEAIRDIIEVDANVTFPFLQVNWSVNNTTTSGSIATGAIGTSYYSNNNLFILGKANNDTDEFDDHIIVHEWGHYFEDRLSRSDSPGGSHSDGDRLDMRLAFGEGFGNALSGMITDDPIYIDTSGNAQASGFSINLEENNNSNPGWYSEASVQSILYDLYDSNNDGNDIVSLGLAPLYNVLINQQKTSEDFTSIFSFITALKSDNASEAAAISQLVNGQSINGTAIDSRGSNETNNAGITDHVLPVYTSVTVAGASTNICIITPFNGASDSNKLSNYRYLTFTIPTAGVYTVTASRTSSTPGYGASSPDFDVLYNGAVKIRAQSEEVNTETATAPLDTGVHAMAITDYNINNGARGTACFDITVSSN